MSQDGNSPPRTISRRTAILASSAAAAGLAGLSSAVRAAATSVTLPNAPSIKALVFDVYGTCTDYWSAFVREGAVLNASKGLDVDWSAVLIQMGGTFPPPLVQLLKKQRPWQSISSLRREGLEQVLKQNGHLDFRDEEINQLNNIWKQSDAWPDMLPALARLKDHFLLATLGNADMGDTMRLAKRNKLPFDLVLAAELAHSVKPDPVVYQVAASLLDLKADQILMVACHKVDLRAAASQGFKTAFIARPLEAGRRGQPDTKPEQDFQYNAVDLQDLADQLLR